MIYSVSISIKVSERKEHLVLNNIDTTKSSNNYDLFAFLFDNTFLFRVLLLPKTFSGLSMYHASVAFHDSSMSSKPIPPE